MWTSRLSFDMAKVTVVPFLTVRVEGNIAKTSTPPGPEPPTLTEFLRALVLSTLLATATKCCSSARSTLASCFAVGTGLPAACTTT